MEAKALTPRVLFDGTVCYEIPPFQRPYVWTEEDQWQPLWDDIARVTAAAVESASQPANGASASTHFLGAIVVKELPSDPGDPKRFSVIDGQQRLTTLQILLDAAQIVAEEAGEDGVAEELQELVLNGANRFANTPRRFKLWPSRIDRPAFEHVMDNSKALPLSLEEAKIAAAHRFFSEEISKWKEAAAANEIPLRALAGVLQERLQIVSITLAGADDDQLIFETLNDRGTALLAADLIKNYVFQRCEDLGADVDAWSDLYWADFDEDWWRAEVSQGRLFRSRIDMFLQYWLTMRRKEEVLTDKVFAEFRAYADEHLEDLASAESFLAHLREDADTFRSFAQLDPTSPQGTFYTRIIERLELGVFIPLLLWLLSEHADKTSSLDASLRAVEGWAVRRTLLRRTMKDVNNLVVALLKELDGCSADEVGAKTVAFLKEQDADARAWPTDDEVISELPKVKAYSNIKQQRLRTVLAAIELDLRTARHEDVTLPDKLEIEHVMPQGWRTFWDDGTAADPEASARRDHLLNTLGNLTLVTQKLNGALSHRPWTDAEAEIVAPSGKDAGLGKRSLLQRYSLLQLNKDIVDAHETAWTEADIHARNVALAEAVVRVWPRD